MSFEALAPYLKDPGTIAGRVGVSRTAMRIRLKQQPLKGVVRLFLRRV
jgi:hypothetical protein